MTEQTTTDRQDAMAAEAAEIELEWAADARWNGIARDYSAADVVRLRGSVVEEHTLARRGAERLFERLHADETPVRALGALTGNQAVQQVRAGLEAIYLSGWQVAADANLSGQTYPDQSLYPANSVPAVVRRINNACSAPTRSSAARAGSRSPTGSRRSSPMRRPGSADRSTRSSSCAA